MNSAQTSFAETAADEAQNLLVIAPPGCGKTELLARRAEALITSLGPYQRILALTFSNKAKANLGARLDQVLGAERRRRHVAVHNFHGHAAQLVRSHGATLGIPTDFAMPDKRTQADAIAPHLEGMEAGAARDLQTLVEGELRRAKQALRTDAQVMDALRGAHPVTVQIETARQQAGNVLFFDDLLRHAQRLLRVPQIARLYRAHFAAILVDEFQDLSLQQLDIALRSCEDSRTVVGDPLQGIYSWTGARPVQVERVLRRLAGEPRELGVSYRSSPKVLAVLGAVSVQLGGQALASNEPDRWFDGGIAALETFATGEDEAVFIRRHAASILERQPSATIGVISRMGWRRSLVDDELTTSAVPCTRWDLTVDDPRIVEIVGDAVSRLGGSPSAPALKAYLTASIDATEVETLADVLDAVDQLDEMAARTGSIAAALHQLRVLDEGAQEAIEPGVHLLNAHTGKGQQFDWVFIPGFEDGHIPSFLAKGPAQLAEEHRVLLVMLSRARHGVVLTHASSLFSERTQRRYSRNVSPWYREIAGAGLANGEELAVHVEQLTA